MKKIIKISVISVIALITVLAVVSFVKGYEAHEGTEVIGERIYEGTQKPLSNNAYDFGTNAYRWAKGWFTDLDATSATIGTLSVTSSVNPGPLEVATSTNPTIRFRGDTNTGISWRDYDELGLMTNGTDRLIINSAGNISIVNDLTLANASTTGYLSIGGDDGADNDILYFDTREENLTWDNTNSYFSLTDDLMITGYASSTSGLNTQGTLHVGSNGTVEGTFTLPALGIAAGTFLAANADGDVIATTTPAAGGSSEWTDGGDYLYPTNGDGIIVSASSTIQGNFNVDGDIILMGKTTLGGKVYQIDTGQSTFFGFEAGRDDDLSNNQNTYIGYQAGQDSAIGSENTALGYSALQFDNSGGMNVAIGNYALWSNTHGYSNTAVGYQSLISHSTGSNNIGLGHYAGHYESGSNAFYVNSFDRGNLAGDKEKSILYGVMDNNKALQILTVNDNLIVSGNSTTTLDAVVGSESNTATTTLSIKTNGTHGSCIEWTNVAGVIYREYIDASGTKVLEAGTCK